MTDDTKPTNDAPVMVDPVRYALQYARNLIGPDEIIDAALASAPAGDGVEAATRMMRDCADDLVSTASHHGQYAAIDQDKIDGLRDAVRDYDAALAPPRAAVGEQSREWWTLEWIAAPRPPVHMKPMRGSQDFDTAEAALAFWHGKPDDSTYVGLTRHVQTSTLQIPPAKVEEKPCQCACHRISGILHAGPCCDRTYEQFDAPAEAEGRA